MRLRRLDLLRYGHFTDRSFELPLPVGGVDFHIVFGPNEAGKSTALSAIEDILFGIPMHSPYNFLHDYSSMRIGAVLENGESSLEVIRRKGTKDTLLGTDNLPVAGGEGALRPFLAGADRSFFQRMFSLDHIRLEAGGREILEAKDEIGQMLFSAGAGIAGLRDRLTDLSNEADELWASRRAKHRRYYQADDKLKNAEKELREQTFTATKWQELKRAFDTAQEAYADVEAEFEKVSAEGKRLSRIRRVYRYVRRKAELDQQFEALGKVISLPEDAQKVLEDSELNESEASTRIDTFSGQLEGARQELEGLTYDEPLVLRADDVRQLHERRIEIRGEKAALPKRQAELDAAEKELRALAAELGWQEEKVSALIKRIPERAKVSVVRSLLGQRGELASDVTNRTEALEEAEAERAELQERLGGMEEATDVSRLEAVIKAVRESGDVAGRLRSAEQHVKDSQERVDRLLASLHPSAPSEKDAAEMQVPPQMGVLGHRDQVQDWERRVRETGQKIETVEQELNRTRKTFQSAVRDEHAITAGELEEVRGRRDALWELVKLKHIDNAPIPDEEGLAYADELDDLAAAFEPAMRTADERADQRFDNAEVAGRLTEMSRIIAEHEENLAQLRKQEETLTKEGERLNADWQAMWGNAPFDPLSPDAMLEWLKTRGDLLEAVDRGAEAIGALETQRKEEHEAKESLLTELAALGIDRTTLENDAVRVVLERAADVQHEYESEAQRKAQLEENSRDAVTNIGRRRRELARANKAWSKWEGQWSTALTDHGLATDSGPDVVAEQIDVIDKMRDKAGRINDLRHQRIDKIKRDVADFESVVAEVVQELAEDLARIIHSVA